MQTQIPALFTLTSLASRLIRFVMVSLLMVLSCPTIASAAIDHDYKALDQLLQKHVRWLPDNKQSQVDYASLKKDQAALAAVLKELSDVSQAEFNQFSKPQQMAFLINAYNAFTLDLILSQYPKLKSIKDLGTLFSSPWKKEFFTLLGAKRNLDWIEHEQLRPKYAEPRVHVAVNCASIGCPALRSDAYTASKLEAQLADGMRRFLSDNTRNRVREGKLEVSPIFKWFAEDFQKGHAGFSEVKDVFAKHAKDISTDAEVVKQLQAKALSIGYTDYDWNLNDIKR